MRPKNWERIVKRECYDGDVVYREVDTFEAGADAYEEGLKKRGLYCEHGEDFIISTKVKPDNPDWAEAFFKTLDKKGWLVFIEETDEDKT